MKSKESILYLIPKSSYYNKTEDVIREAKNMHEEVFSEDRELYTYMLYFNEATYYSKSLLIQRLLSNSLHKEGNSSVLLDDPKRLEIEDALIFRSLTNENMTHALKMLLTLKEAKINNARVSRLILRFIFGRRNLERICIKYKKKIKSLLIHALGKSKLHHISEETKKGNQLFDKWIKPFAKQDAKEVIDFVLNKERTFNNQYFIQYHSIKEHFKNDTLREVKECNLPIEVLIGMNNDFKRFMSLSELVSIGVTSEKQKIQLQQAIKREDKPKIELKVDLSKYSAMELYKYLYSNPELTNEEKDDVYAHIENRTSSVLSTSKVELFNGEAFAVVADFSDSHFGSNETPMHPLYKNLVMSHVLSPANNCYYVGGTLDEDKGMLVPSGDSNLSQGLIDAVKGGHKNIIIISDGFENVGSIEAVYKQLKNIGYDLQVLHLNPVFSPKNFSFKSLGESIPTIPFFDAENIESIELFYLLNHDPAAFKARLREKIEADCFPKQNQPASPVLI